MSTCPGMVCNCDYMFWGLQLGAVLFNDPTVLFNDPMSVRLSTLCLSLGAHNCDYIVHIVSVHVLCLLVYSDYTTVLAWP